MTKNRNDNPPREINEVVFLINDIADEKDLVGLTVAEPMPRTVIRLKNMLARLPLLENKTVTKPFLFRTEQTRHVCAFQFQQLDFNVQSARIAGQAAVCSDDPVAGDNNGNRIMTDCSADGLRRHFGFSGFSGDHFGYTAVSPDLSQRNIT